MKLIKEAMATKVKLAHPQDMIADAAATMKEFDVGMLPVAEGEKLVGALTDRDIVVRGVADKMNLKETRVGDVMTHDVDVCYEDQSIDEVAQTMKQDQIRRIIVVNRDDQLAGVISLGDLAGHTNVETSGEVLRKISKPSP
jgi:CBS domain-containing protein